MHKKLITFAGPVGCSKTPVAYFLSWNLALPLLNNDSIRTEVLEDTGTRDHNEYIRRRNDRIERMFASGEACIYDASIDRSWSELQSSVQQYEYEVFVISFDLSKELMTALLKRKHYTESLARLDELLLDHEHFLAKYHDLIGLSITDALFADRLRISLHAVKEWLHGNE